VLRQCSTANCTLVQLPQACRTDVFSNVDHRPIFQGLAIGTHDPGVCWLVAPAFPKPTGLLWFQWCMLRPARELHCYDAFNIQAPVKVCPTVEHAATTPVQLLWLTFANH
jgi:hypothetical protein